MDNFEDTLTKKLKESLVAPSNQWETNTLDKLAILVDNDNSNNFNLLTFNYLTYMNKKSLILGGISFAALTLLIVLTAIVIFNRLQNNNKIDTANLTESELNELYLRIAEANPTFDSDAAVSRGSNASADLESALSSYVADSKLIAPYYGEENVLYTNTYTNSYGPAVGSCYTFGYYGTYAPGDVETSESQTVYVGGYANSVSKVTRGDGQVTSYYSNIANASSNTSYEYQGGSFAVKFNYPVYSAMPLARVTDVVTESTLSEESLIVAPDLYVDDGTTSSDQPIENLSEDPATRIKQLFGDNATIIGTKNEGGSDYYVVESTYEVNCLEQNYRTLSLSSVEPTFTNTTINHYKIDPETYLVVDTAVYLDAATENNLISVSTTTSTERAVSGFDEVSSLFSFPFNVTVREITVPEYSPESEINKTRSMIQDMGIDVLKPTNENLILDSITLYDNEEQNNIYGYSSERDFYPAGAVGDKIYEMYTGGSTFNYDPDTLYEDGSYFPTSLGYAYFNSSDYATSLSYTLYEDTGRNYDNLLAGLGTGKASFTNSDVNTTIDGTIVPAVLLTYTYDESSYGVAEGTGASDSVEPSAPEAITLAPTNYNELLIRHNGIIYQISSYSSTSTLELGSLVFTSLSNTELETVFATMVTRYTTPEILY